jgi:hypothetical protein
MNWLQLLREANHIVRRRFISFRRSAQFSSA